ncbi:MAG: 30S ribosomal protein S6 [Microgenomates group bacterium GW2011_GWF2_45_18]|nr:MAG: 30S ribosomal protein S6 [Microgenomates group bacterium GW2011_GWF1_44_10]KKU01821.1 MAG: 30S ribosomal protein S6 [Microgenomates group bacterium GW2011_GWF2_45_18]OGJ41454.1 MAG: 30S ribosomal protein S6 [Candidatus Pacebacteria bacterium RIFOXYB1_FULL_44_10]HAU98875.1 30S ribosomal protein S6 [Candidatus Paceibacterota bacterium]HAX01167.1 30S ribosomal protein S6 [Candidatus Paceibacterota bacterium]
MRVCMYEMTVLFSPDLSSADLQLSQDAVEKVVTSNKGKIVEKQDWGRKLLSYKIKKRDEAVFQFYILELPCEVAQTVEHEVLLSNGVLRNLVVRKEDDNSKK